MANKTVYPYGTDGQLPSSIGLINDLVTGGVDKALTAEQGKVLGGLLLEEKEIDLSGEYKYNYFIDDNNLWFNATTNIKVRCCFILIRGASSFRCTANGGYCTFAFLKTTTRSDGATPDFADGYEGRFGISDGETRTYDIPSDANYLYVFAQNSSGTDITGRYDDLTVSFSRLEQLKDKETLRTIRPELTYDIIRASNGDFSTNSDFVDMNMITTPRFIKTNMPFSVKAGADCSMKLYYYGSDFSYLGYDASATALTKDTVAEISLAYNCSYIKFYLSNSEGMPMTTVELTGYFPDDWDTFNPRPSDSGYHRVSVLVNVTDPTCCDEETSTVQDASQILPDYGVICLPEQYKNTGKPTRLIIYCHGAAVNYASDVTRFNSQDLDPTYWLAEGCAILDVEGNPFNNTDEHFCVPQAMDCYVAAYKWAVLHYNLCRDGVFLGGRSMGGGMTFALMRTQCPIPIIAACPNVPWSSAMGQSSRARKLFWATHCGFSIPSGYSFGDATYTSGDKQVFIDNFDKLIKNNPVICGVTNTPVSSEEKQSFIDCYTSQSAERKALWETYRMKAKCPVKLFGCNQDETCPPQYTSALLYQMLINGAQIAELRLFNSYKDYTGTGTSAHHYDTQDPALRADITTSYGEELEDVPIVYIEMLAFWRRYEQGL